MPPVTLLPMERTTAATNVLLAVLAIFGAQQLYRLRHQDPWKASLWIGAFTLLAVASLLGALAHAFTWPPRTRGLIVLALNAALGATIALFGTGALYDLAGRRAARLVLPVLLALALACLVIAQRSPGTVRVFILYESVAMLCALALYTWCALRGDAPGAWWMVAGILTSLLAAAIQVSRAIQVTVIWPFDHNGVFHLVQMVGVLLLLAGLRRGLLGQPVVLQPASAMPR